VQFLDRVRWLDESDAALRLATALVADGAVPATAAADAAHIAIAAVCGMQYLLTWNCAHINNAQRIGVIELVCRRLNTACPRVCTPEELA
jgi:hypothetical protein